MNIWKLLLAAVLLMPLTGWAMWGTTDGMIERHEVTRHLGQRPPHKH